LREPLGRQATPAAARGACFDTEFHIAAIGRNQTEARRSALLLLIWSVTSSTRTAGGRPVTDKGRRVRAINPHTPGDAARLAAISRGEFVLNGLRNQDPRPLLFARPGRTKADQKRQAAAVSRQLRLLRAHRLIRKVPHTHCCHDFRVR
jgi:hypothetical protein